MIATSFGSSIIFAAATSRPVAGLLYAQAGSRNHRWPAANTSIGVLIRATLWWGKPKRSAVHNAAGQVLLVMFPATAEGTARARLVKWDTADALLWDDVEVANLYDTCAKAVKLRYHPYGQEVGTATANDTVKFATYTRDAHSGVDYAMNRYYMSTWGRFTTADPYRASGGPGDPGSWNRYSYVQGDPVNYFDPAGLQLRGPIEWLDCWAGESPGCAWRWSVPYEPISGGGVGGESGSGATKWRPIGHKGALDALLREDCFKLFGFESSADAQSAFGKVNFTPAYLGQLKITPDESGGRRIVRGTPPPAQTVDNTVQVNYNYNWIDFTMVTAINVATGSSEYFDYVAAMNNGMGSNLTIANLPSLFLLHEFKHTILGGAAPQETDLKAYNSPIYEACFK